MSHRRGAWIGTKERVRGEIASMRHGFHGLRPRRHLACTYPFRDIDSFLPRPIAQLSLRTIATSQPEGRHVVETIGHGKVVREPSRSRLVAEGGLGGVGNASQRREAARVEQATLRSSPPPSSSSSSLSPLTSSRASTQQAAILAVRTSLLISRPLPRI